MRERFPVGSVVTHALLALGALVMVFPFVWQALTAFKTMPESVQVPPTFLPAEWNGAAFQQVFTALPFAEMLGNSEQCSRPVDRPRVGT